MEKTPNEKGCNIFVVNLNGSGNSAVVGSASSNAKSEYYVVQSDSGLQKQLDEFRNELNKLTELNENQKERLNKVIEDLSDHLNEPEEKQGKWRDKFNTTVEVIGDVLGVASKIASIAAKIGLPFPL